MPLSYGKSPKAFSHNVKAEMAANKPQKQAVAIAYAIKRKNKAHGGMIENEKLHPEHEPMEPHYPERPMTHRIVMGIRKAMGGSVDGYAEGGEVLPESHEDQEYYDEDLFSDEMENMEGAEDADLPHPDLDHADDDGMHKRIKKILRR